MDDDALYSFDVGVFYESMFTKLLHLQKLFFI